MTDAPKPKRQPGGQNLPAMQPSAELAAITGVEPLSRAKVVQAVWAYIHQHGLQDKKDKRMINPDPVLGRVLGPTAINMFAMQKELSKHLTRVAG